MLKEIYIQNFALISQLHIPIEKGFTVITGETGSGKSIIIDALSMCLGKRGGKDFIRSGQEKAVIELRIENISDTLQKELLEIGIEAEGQLIVTREIQKDGSSVSRLNRRMVPLGILKSVMAELVTIHGQNEYELITQVEKQRYLLDNFGKNVIESSKLEYQSFYKKYLELEEKIKALSNHKDSGQLARELDLLYYQQNEIHSAEIKEGELELLEEEKRQLAHFEKIQDSFQIAYSQLYQDEKSVLTQLDKTISVLLDIEPYSEIASKCKRSLEDAYYIVEDNSNELARNIESDSFDVARLDYIISRLDLLNRLYRKYGGDYTQTKEYYHEISHRINQIEKRDELLKEYAVQKEKMEAQLLKYAKVLQNNRKKVAKDLETKVIQELSTLNLKNTQYQIRFSEKEFSLDGIDDVSFFVSFNVGEEPKAFHKIASGGEVSRFMLALKNIISTTDEIDTMIFDEIDTGVSGIAANQIGEKLKEIGKYKQVICITHLPQIASFGRQHLLVEKKEHAGSVNTDIVFLNEKDRVKEIAKMTVGENITPISLENALELLHKNQKEMK